MTEFLHRNARRFAMSFCLATTLALTSCGTTPNGSGGPATSGEPRIAAFAATPSTVTAGDSATLSWTVQNADTISIAPGIGIVQGGSVAVTPATTTTYTLTAQNASGTSTATSSVTVTSAGAEPLRADVVLDDERAARRFLPVEGGAVSATDAAGTTYTLAVPPGALLQPARILLTPVASAAGLPLSGGLLAGVSIEPSGLVFGAPVTLEIELATTAEADEQIGFAVSAGGEAHLYPLGGPAGTIALELARTGGYLLGRGTATDRYEANEHVPVDPRARIDQALAPLLHGYRVGDLSEQELQDELADALRTGYAHIVLPALEAAEATLGIGSTSSTDPGALRTSSGTPSIEALQTFNHVIAHWEQQLVAHGFGEEFMGEEREDLNERIFDIVSTASYALMGRCVEEHDLMVIGYLLELQRMLERKGLTEAGFTMENCLRFRLEFDSTVTLDHAVSGYSTSFTARIRAEVPLGTDLTGSTTSEYESFIKQGTAVAHDGVTCDHREHGTPSGDVMTVVGGSVDFLAGSGSTTVEDMYLAIDVGMPAEHTEVTCSNGDTWTFSGHEWLAYFQLSHRDDMIDDQWVSHPVVITGWEVAQPSGVSDVIARKTYTGSWAGAATDTTTLVLRHTPDDSGTP